MKKLITALMLISLITGSALLNAYAQDASTKAPAPAAKEATGMSIAKLVVGTDVKDKEAVGVAETFPSSTAKVICFLEAKSITEDTKITFVWIYNGKELLKTDMTLKAGPKWRTRADKNLRGQKGDWKVEVRSAAGDILKDVKFKVE
jgi:hypothetical protein